MRFLIIVLDFSGTLETQKRTGKNTKYREMNANSFFFNVPLIVNNDIEHSIDEQRWFLLGQTDSSRFLFVVFTVRKDLIRIISARDMNIREKDVYDEQIKKYS